MSTETKFRLSLASAVVGAALIAFALLLLPWLATR